MARAEILTGGPPEGVRYLDHTADVGIEVEGGSLDECFVRAAAGVFALMFVPPSQREARRDRGVEVNLEAAWPEELLVAWLEELLYLSEVDELLFLWFEAETDGRRLRGRAGGIPITPDVEPAGPAVKAVTRHDLRVERDGERWRARVILDV